MVVDLGWVDFDLNIPPPPCRLIEMMQYFTEYHDLFYTGFLRKDSSCDPDREGFPSALPDPNCPCAASPGSRPSDSP